MSNIYLHILAAIVGHACNETSNIKCCGYFVYREKICKKKNPSLEEAG